jgi:uronate dehydrogenase
MPTKTVLITGAAGRIGGFLRPRLRGDGRRLRLLDVAPLSAMYGAEEAVTASVTDRDAIREACTGVDAVVHLGGLAGEAEWADILHTNIHGTWCVLDAAREAGVPRVVLASSNHAVGFVTRRDEPLPDAEFPRPDTYYGVAKVTMEVLGSLYADRHRMDVVCLRIGTCRERPPDTRALSTWLSPDDAARLVEAALMVPSPGFRVVWGVSANTRRWWSAAGGDAIGYHPTDDAEVYAAELPDPDVRAAGPTRVGGPWATPAR